MPGYSELEVKRTSMYSGDVEFRNICNEYYQLSNELRAKKYELEAIDRLIIRSGRITTQSADGLATSGTIASDVVSVHQTLREIGGAETQIRDPSSNDVRYMSVPDDLDKFFTRPVEIGSFSIPMHTDTTHTFDVADLYFADPAVRAKIRNFAFMRGDLVVKVSVSGTPFHSGRIIASAYPWSVTNTSFNTLFDPSAGWSDLQDIYLSQARIKALIDVKENKPVEMLLPYISPSPLARLFNTSSSPMTGVPTDWSGMWKLVVKTLNTVKAVSTDPSLVYVYVYAYMKNVQIGVPTGTVMEVKTQSDERIRGPVEKIASTVAYYSKMAINIPPISMYAKASAMAFGTLSKVAALFGWSAPVLITKPSRMKNEPYQNGTNLIQYDTGQRLTLDPKQELVVSTEYVRVAEDELAFSHLCAIESYVSTFSWHHGDEPMVPIRYMPVSPQLCTVWQSPELGVNNVVPTPLHMVSQMFAFWHGSITITFEIVCSSFDRGKIGIYFDPNSTQYVSQVAGLNLNKQHIHVWDIQETQRYSVCIPWASARPWLRIFPSGNEFRAQTNTYLDTGGIDLWANGYLAVFPITKLQSPDNSDVSINVYIKSDDIHFNRLTQRNVPTSRSVTYQSGENAEVSELDVSNVPVTCEDIVTGDINSTGIMDHFFGEEPLSLRSIFKRFSYSGRLSTEGGITDQLTGLRAVFNVYPPMLPRIGYDSDNSQLFTYWRQAFLSMRGGLRKRISVVCNGQPSSTPLYVSNGIPDGVTPAPVVNIDPVATVFHQHMTWDGSAMYVPSTNGGIEFEVPCYTPNYFHWSSDQDPYRQVGTPFRGQDETRYYTVCCYLPPGNQKVEVIEHTATADDFQMSYFLGGVPYVPNDP